MQEEARKKAVEAAEASKEESDNLNVTKNKVVELREALDSGSLSQQEAIDKRAELYNIQKDLIEQYGSEASGIDLVTGSIDAQTDVINRLNKANLEQKV